MIVLTTLAESKCCLGTVTARLPCTPHAGATLPASAQIQLVTLNGHPAAYTVRDTNAGRQVFVSTPCNGHTAKVHIVSG